MPTKRSENAVPRRRNCRRDDSGGSCCGALSPDTPRIRVLPAMPQPGDTTSVLAPLFLRIDPADAGRAYAGLSGPLSERQGAGTEYPGWPVFDTDTGTLGGDQGLQECRDPRVDGQAVDERCGRSGVRPGLSAEDEASCATHRPARSCSSVVATRCSA